MESIKIIILISSYNRYDNLIGLIEQLQSQNTKYDFDIIVSNDSSIDVRYDTLTNVVPNINVVNTDKNNGKRGYWKTINNLFNPLVNLDFNYVIQLDDDFLLCESFIDTVVTFFGELIIKNPNIVTMSLHLNNVEELTANRWGLGNRWVDGGTIYSKKALEVLNYRIDEISNSRWTDNPNKSSGVWQQVSNTLNKHKLICVKPNYSFVKHHDSDKSMMNSDIRKQIPINTYNFIDEVEKNEDIKIFELKTITASVIGPRNLKERRKMEKEAKLIEQRERTLAKEKIIEERKPRHIIVDSNVNKQFVTEIQNLKKKKTLTNPKQRPIR